MRITKALDIGLGLTALLGCAYAVQTAITYAPTEKPARYALCALTAVVITAGIKMRQYCNSLKIAYERHDLGRIEPDGLRKIVK